MKRRDFVRSTLLGGPLAAVLAQSAEPSVRQAAGQTLRVATFQADVTPPIGAVLCHGNVAPAREIVSPLTARGMILLAGDRPVVVCAVDWVGISNGSHDAWRSLLADAVGTSVDRVSVHTVHQHDTPGIDASTERILAEHGLSGAMYDVAFADRALQQVARAAQAAVADAQPVTHLGYGQGRVERVASNRRILGPDGKWMLQRQSRCSNPQAVAAPEGTIDPDVRLVSLWNDDRPLISLTYYACHPQSYYGQGGVNWDFPGYARAARQTAVPEALHVHFDGAGGDIAAGKYNDGSPENRPALAARLEQGMRDAWQTMRRIPLAADDVAWQVQRVSLPVRETIDEASRLATLNDPARKQRDRIFAARDLAWLRRMRSGHQLEIGCLQLGPVSMLHLPGELCIAYQLAAQAICPDRFVCLAAYGDLGPGYICTEIAYSQGGYETGFVSRVAPRVEGTLLAAMRNLR
jgi:hypothetical protein